MFVKVYPQSPKLIAIEVEKIHLIGPNSVFISVSAYFIIGSYLKYTGLNTVSF